MNHKLLCHAAENTIDYMTMLCGHIGNCQYDPAWSEAREALQNAIKQCDKAMRK